jgi:two-component system response regulator WspF
MKIAIVNDMPMAVEACAGRWPSSRRTRWSGWPATARGGAALRRTTPDLILMDLIMPVMDGVEATRRIMAETPCAIVIVTVDRQQNVHRVFEAMGHGALDVVDTPALGAGNAQEAAAPLLRKILNIGWLIGSAAPRPGRNRTAACVGKAAPGGHRLVGGRPGGAGSLAQGLPRDFPPPSCWCSTSTRCSPPAWPNGWQRQGCRCAWPAKANRRRRRGAAGRHQSPYSLLKNGTLAYTAEPVNEIYRPSIDVFFESVATTGTAMRGRAADRHGARRRPRP